MSEQARLAVCFDDEVSVAARGGAGEGEQASTPRRKVEKKNMFIKWHRSSFQQLSSSVFFFLSSRKKTRVVQMLVIRGWRGWRAGRPEGRRRC